MTLNYNHCSICNRNSIRSANLCSLVSLNYCRSIMAIWTIVDVDFSQKGKVYLYKYLRVIRIECFIALNYPETSFRRVLSGRNHPVFKKHSFSSQLNWYFSNYHLVGRTVARTRCHTRPISAVKWSTLL